MRKPTGMPVLGPLSDSDQPGSNDIAVDDPDDQPPSSELIAEAADTDDDGDDLLSNILQAAVNDKLPDPIAEHLESPPPPIITPPSSVGSNHGKVIDFGGPPSFQPPETPPLSNKMTKQESSPIATVKSPVSSNNVKNSGRPNPAKSPRGRGRPPKSKPKEDNSAQVIKPGISASKDTANNSKKSVSRQKSTKSKSASEAEKKTLTSMGGSSKRARLPKVKSPKSKKFISSSEESSSSESSDSNSGNSSDEDEVAWKPEKFKSSPCSTRSPKDSKNANVSSSLSKRTSPGRAGTPKKLNLVGSPKKLLEDSPMPTYVNPSMESELDLEEVFSATKFSPYTDITAPEPILSPLPNRDCTLSRTTQIPKAATSPTKSSPTSSISAISRSNAEELGGKNIQSGSDENKYGVTYVEGRPSIMVRIDLAKLDKWPSRTQRPSGSDLDADEQEVSAFIKDGKSLLEVKQMPSIVEPLPPSPMPRVHSDSISTSSEFDDGEIKDSDDDKSDSENEISDSNNNRKHDVKGDNKSDSSSRESGSSSSDESDDEEDNKSVIESVSSEIKKEDISNKEQAATDKTESAAPNNKKLTASGQKEVLNQIFKHNEKPSLSTVKIPKKRPQSPSHREDHKRARTDHNRRSDYNHRE